MDFINFRVNTKSPSGKLEHKIEADSQQKLVMRFLLRDSASKKPMRVHQAFVRLTSVSESANNKRGHEIFFVAEPDAAHVYKFDMVIFLLLRDFIIQSIPSRENLFRYNGKYTSSACLLCIFDKL